MANEPDVIDLTESFTLVDHSNLANTVIDLDDSVVVVPDSPQVQPSGRLLDVSVQITSNGKPAVLTRSARSSRRSRSSTDEATRHNITLQNIHPNSIKFVLSKVQEKGSHAASKEQRERESIRERSPVKIGDCPICFDKLGKNPLASTKCGHVFCAACLEQSLRLGKKCPTCRQALKGSGAYHRLFLSRD